MRLAIFSPLTPVRSALSDYSEGVLPYLAEQADVTVVTTARTDEEARRLLALFGMPFRGQASSQAIA